MKDRAKVAINATFMYEKPTGLGTYNYELLIELLRLESDFDLVVYSCSSELKRLYPERVTLISPYTSPSFGFKGHLLRYIWQQIVLPIKLRKGKVCLLYSTVPEGILFPNIKQIITIHDTLPVRYPEMYPMMKYHFYYNLPLLLKNAWVIICVSESTKKDIINSYDIKDKPIHVIYEGVDRKRFYPREKERVRKGYGLGRYLFYVGDMRPHKNLERTLEAFVTLNLRDVKFVIGGKRDPRFYPKIEKKVNELSLRDRVIFLDYVDREDLPHFYSGAEAFLFPSLYEGFGLPALEAMACGCPVVVSNTSSLPEVCGDAACYVDPFNADSIAEGINKVLRDEGLRNSLIQKGLERAKLFTWEKTARRILELITNLLKSKNWEVGNGK